MKFRSFALAAVLGMFVATPAFAACGSDPIEDCKDSWSNALENLEHSNSLSDAIDNAKELYDAGKECISCAGDSLSGSNDYSSGTYSSGDGVR